MPSSSPPRRGAAAHAPRQCLRVESPRMPERAAASHPTAATAPAGPRRPAAASTGFVQAPVLAVFDESPEIRTFRLARPEGFAFTPGQFLTVRLRTDGRELVRCYSISSAPHA